MGKCKHYRDEVCTNADCPLCADFCPVSDIPGVCRFEDRGDRTNADKIRSMTDEKLADFLPNLCAHINPRENDCLKYGSCYKCVKKWLQEDAD